MTLLRTLEELSSVGNTPVNIRFNACVFSEEIVRSCAARHGESLVLNADGTINVQPGTTSRDILRQFASELISAVREQGE